MGRTDEDAITWRLIPAKLEPPRRPRGFLSRQQLLERLGLDLQRKLSVIVGPAGYGKSTLLAEWRDALVAGNVAVAWLSLDRDDNDPNQFMAYLLETVAHSAPALSPRLRDILRNDPIAPIGAIVSMLCTEIGAYDLPLVLILDDFDCLTSTDIHESVQRLLRYAPDNFFCALGSRVEPPLPLSVFAAAGQLVRLTASHLRFTEEEARTFLNATVGAKLEAAEVATLFAAMDGWATGLQMVALSLTGQQDATDLAELLQRVSGDSDAYLTENVLKDVPPPIVDFLLRTSIVDSLSPELCNAITGSDDARGTLDWLEARNLFLNRVDGNRQWYRFQTLFSEYLRRRLTQRLPNEVVVLHRRASEWLAAHGQWIEAVRHALAAGDVERATLWVEDGAMTFLERGDVRTVLSLVAKLPADAIRGRLRLRVAHTWALALTLQTAEASSALAKITDELDQIRCELLAVGAALAGLNEDDKRALELGQRALDLKPPHGAWVERLAQTTVMYGLGAAARFEELEPFRDAEHAAIAPDESVYAAIYRQTIFSHCSFLEGNLPEAARLLDIALERAEVTVGRCSAAAVLPAGYLSLIVYEANDLARARELVRGRLALAFETCPQGSLEGLCLTLARLHALEGSFNEAHEILQRTHVVAHKRKWLRLQAACTAEQVRLYVRANRLADAAAKSDEMTALTSSKSLGERSVSIDTWHHVRSARCRLLIARNEGASALPELRALLAELRSARRGYLATCTAVLLAIALDQAHLRAEALDVLAPAVRFGRENGLARTFLDEADFVGLLLSELTLQHDSPSGANVSYVTLLIASISQGGSSPSIPDEPAAAGILSAREIEILDYITRGLTNKEVARALRIAPETVKWHLKHIYEKLEVSSRIQAVHKIASAGHPKSHR